MDEQKENTSEKPENTAENNDAGNKYETTDIIERARQERERLEEANKKKEELLNREEKLLAKRQLSGTAEAGQDKPQKKEISDIEFANTLMTQENPFVERK